MTSRFIKILIFFIFLLSKTIFATEIIDDSCKTKYPILLVHGIAFRDDIKLFPYWGNIPKTLRKHGAKVYLAHQNAFDSHENNAKIIKQRIFQILKETNTKKVNIIAHSKGGLEARYMISKLGMGQYVASLTTLSTPHRGSFLADTLMEFLEKKNAINFASKTVKSVAQLAGDKNADVYASGHELTREYMIEFNKNVPNIEGVYYQSFGSVVEKPKGLAFRIFNQILSEKEGKNDAIVSLNSTKWGNFRGEVKAKKGGVSHADIIGMTYIFKKNSFNAYDFFIEIVKDLKNRDF